MSTIRYTNSPVTSKNNGGFILILVIGVSLVLSMIAISFLSLASAKYAKTTADISDASAVYAAEAGISDTVARLYADSAFTGYSTKKALYSSTDRGKAEYTTTVTNNGNDTFTVTSTGYLSRHPSDTTPYVQKKLKTVIFSNREPVSENIVVGAGGISVLNDFQPGIKTAFTGGSLYTRGKIKLEGLGANIGTPTNPVTVSAANMGCGTSATGPQLCPTNQPPITTIDNNSFNPGMPKIYGTVCATNQPASAFIEPGPTGAGLKEGCIAPDIGLPTFDKAAFTSRTTTTVSTSNLCSGWGGATMTLPANALINASPNIQSMSGECVITITGDVYIKGNLGVGVNARILVADSVGTRTPTIVVNGNVEITGNAKGIFANSSGTGLNIISFASSDTACSNSDTCKKLSSTAHEYNSSQQNYPPYEKGISFTGSSGSSPVDFSALSAYAYFGGIYYRMDGNHYIRSIGGQSFLMKQLHVNGLDNYLHATDSTAPFGNYVYRTKYQIGDYLPIYE